MSLAGRAALMTGAASGIGLATSKAMLAQGLSSLIAFDRSPEMVAIADDLQQMYPDSKIISHVADVTDPLALKSAFETPLAQPLTIVGNNAGIGGDDWEKTLAVDLAAVIMGTQFALARFKQEAAGGVVINVASMAGLAPMSFDPVYTAAKHGVVGYSRCFQHLARKNIRVNCLCPAFIDTPLVQKLVDDPMMGGAGQAAIDSLGGMVPMDKAVGAFMDMIVNEDHNGTCMTVTNANPDPTPMKFPFNS